jgi:hypothetical protein
MLIAIVPRSNDSYVGTLSCCSIWLRALTSDCPAGESSRGRMSMLTTHRSVQLPVSVSMGWDAATQHSHAHALDVDR